MAKTQTYATVAAVAVVGLLGATMYYATRPATDDPFAPCRESAIAGGAGSIGGPFTLVDETGKTVTDKDVFTKPSLVYFGYTFCPDVCPADTARNAEAVDAAAALGYDVQPVFISIDPERDTPEVVADFTDYLHEDMLGLTGTPSRSRRRRRPTRPITANRMAIRNTTWSTTRHSPISCCPRSALSISSDATRLPKTLRIKWPALSGYCRLRKLTSVPPRNNVAQVL